MSDKKFFSPDDLARYWEGYDTLKALSEESGANLTPEEIGRAAFRSWEIRSGLGFPVRREGSGTP